MPPWLFERHPETKPEQWVALGKDSYADRSAVIAEGVKIARWVTICEGSSIGPGSELGDGVAILNHVTIGERVMVEKWVAIASYTTIEAGRKISRSIVATHFSPRPIPGWTFGEAVQSPIGWTVPAIYDVEPENCKYCEGPVRRDGSFLVICRDVPSEGKHVYLSLKQRNYLCRSCMRKMRQPIPDRFPQSQVMRRLGDYVVAASAHRSMMTIATDTGLGLSAIRKLVDRDSGARPRVLPDRVERFG